ncbi:MAG TPA: ribosome maturation factor RimM [Anaerolineales bacterium]|nr:ribosome maturation factor RimM [Anaerolineales bacterium]HNN12540.1 ribosome maturation factor RimM [Anaerolineales bacterium]HNO32486.1 ribosome maturation factor RimM [Anaerolineales bacterium]
MAEQKTSGSPKGESIYLAIGFLRRPHGVQGEIIMDLHTDFPDRIRSGRKVYIGEKHEAATLGGARIHGDGMLVRVKGFDTPESAGRFRNQWVYVKATEVPQLPDGQFYKYELIDVAVVTDDGRALGTIVEILETGANDVYVVKNEAGKEILLPAIPSVVLETDMASRLMKVQLLEGLVDDSGK